MFEVLATPILKVIELLLGAGSSRKKLRVDDKERAAEYLVKVSDCLRRMATKFEQGQLPIEECAELAVYADGFPDTVRRVLGPTNAPIAAAAIGECHYYRGGLRLAPYSIDALSKSGTYSLLEASGRLLAFATEIRSR